MDALDAYEDLMELGHHLVDLPVEPQYGKMVLYSVVLKCPRPSTHHSMYTGLQGPL